MTFNSFNFLIFFVAIFLVYYFPLKGKTKAQNWLLLIASYVFYGIANWMMIPLLVSATAIFYFLGLAIQASQEKKRSILTAIGVLLGISFLLYFKYFNFFIESFSNLFNSIGLNTNWSTFNIILPLGISFFTFRLISYVIEISRGKTEPTKDFVVFATYVGFFPTIMSGPIDRPNNFIPQLKEKRLFNYDLVVAGCHQILWGLFQKVVIADNLAGIINGVWANIPSQSGSTLFVMAILYSFQIYTDFSGYSHMAIGVGKILGFRITKNFNYPYFSRNIAEFWRNWHISLTSWLTDYIFIPLNIKFRDLGNWGIILAILINMVIVGLWHGANWTFVVFGLFHGLLFIPLILNGSIFKKKKLKVNKLGLPSLKDVSKILLTFLLWTFSLLIFRADDLDQTITYLSKILSPSLFTIPSFVDLLLVFTTVIFIVIFMLVEWFLRSYEVPISNFKLKKPFNYMLYYSIVFCIIYFGNFGSSQFIYFKF